MQHLAARREIVKGTSNARGITTGCKFTLDKNPDTTQNREYLVVATTTHVPGWRRAAPSGATSSSTISSCEFTAIPGSTQFRLEQLHRRGRACAGRRPRVSSARARRGDHHRPVRPHQGEVLLGPQRDAGRERLLLDPRRAELGRRRLGRHGHPAHRPGSRSSISSTAIPTGRSSPAASTTPPTRCPTRCTTTRRAAPSRPIPRTGGGGFNELRFEDKKGSEEVFFQAQKDYNMTVLNNETSTITQDRTTTVQKGNDSLTVSEGNRSVTVSQGNDSHTVSQGNRSVTISQGSDSAERLDGRPHGDGQQGQQHDGQPGQRQPDRLRRQPLDHHLGRRQHDQGGAGDLGDLRPVDHVAGRRQQHRHQHQRRDHQRRHDRPDRQRVDHAAGQRRSR